MANLSGRVQEWIPRYLIAERWPGWLPRSLPPSWRRPGRRTDSPWASTPVSEQIRDQIDALFDGFRELVEDVARLGAQLIIQTAVEAEVTAFLGRARYQRGADGEPCSVGIRNIGMRNGYQPPTAVKTTAGPVAVRPKLRGTDQPFVSRLFGTGITKSNALEWLVIAGFVRGLSTRDVEATLADLCNQQRCSACR